MKKIVAVITLLVGVFIMLLSYVKSRDKLKVIDF